MPSKGLFRLDVALSEAACWYRHQGSTENALPSLGLMEGQSVMMTSPGSWRTGPPRR